MHACGTGAAVILNAHRSETGSTVATTPGSSSSRLPRSELRLATTVVAPVRCRRDDYAFLPEAALGGLNCSGTTTTAITQVDPLAVALELEAQVAPPDVKIGMNPARGLVAVPTWFWVDGYDGKVLSAAKPAVEQYQTCQGVAQRDAGGAVALGVDRRPSMQQSCTIDTSTFLVEVRLWPEQFAWDFGDGTSEQIACRDQGNCTDGLGQRYVDADHPSSVQHPYQWSSLGANGSSDAYSVQVLVTFAAEYRVSLNGADGGWGGLPERTLGWSASHQVQEAQAVLTGH
jgi:hypothetical protein